MFCEKPQQVLTHYGINVGHGIAPLVENANQLLQICDRVEPQRCLFGSVSAIEVAANSNVLGVAGKLANMVDVIGQYVDMQDFSPCFAAYEIRVQHPRVAGNADDPASINHDLQLLVGELSLRGNQRPAGLMACEHRAIEKTTNELEVMT